LLKEVVNRVIAIWNQVAYPLKGLLDVIHGLKACMVISVKLLVLTRSLVVSEYIAPAPPKTSVLISVATFRRTISGFSYLSVLAY
jgi:hypothetical protein